MFYEDPLRPNNFDAMAEVARHIHIPIATGERFHSIYQFQMLLTRNAVQYLRPDVCLVGGITGAKKVAALAEAPRCVGGAAQSAVAGQHRGVPADRRLHPELRHPGVPASARTRPPKSEIVKGTPSRRPGLPDHPRRAGHRHRAAPGRGRGHPRNDRAKW